MKTLKPFVLFISLLILIPVSFTQQCKRRCNCLQKNFSFNKCTGGITDINLHFDTKEITIYCRKLISDNTDGIITFDARYLSVIDDNSPLTLEAMIQKCYKTKSKNIKYAIDLNKLHYISATNIVLKNENAIRHLTIQGSSEINEQVNISVVGPQFGSDLETLIVNSVTVPDLKNYIQNIPKIRTLDLTLNNIDTLPAQAFANLTRLRSFSLRKNRIKILDQSMFNGSTDIVSLDLSNNMIIDLENTTFQNINKVKYLNLSENNLGKLESGTFASLLGLEVLDLSMNRNLTFPHNIFENLSSLINLNLSRCHIKYIPETFFEGCQEILMLNLSRNQITNLENNTFQNLSALTVLDVSYNKLESLPIELFRPLKKLQNIYLGANKLTMFSSKLFWSIESLKSIDLSNNQINRFHNSLGRFHAHSINLKQNEITKFPEFLLYVVVNLQNLDLSYNLISAVELVKDLIPKTCNVDIDLSNNAIKKVNITPIEAISGTVVNRNWNVTLNLAKTHLKCYCGIFRLDQTSEMHANAILQVTNQESICSDRAANLKCPIIHIRNCPTKCLCYFRALDNSIVANCSFRNLTKFPTIVKLKSMHYMHKHNQTVVLLNGNHLNGEGQDRLRNYHNVTYLDLSWNEISQIKWLPEHLLKLNLGNNRLTTLSEEIVKALEKNKYLKWISFQNNSWICDCNAYYLQKYLRDYNNLKLDPSQVLCTGTKEKLLHAEICEPPTNTLKVALPVGLTTVFALISALLALYYRYSTNIKVFLYSKNLCLWFVEEEEIDKEKTYDIFISYSHKDENFVQNELLPKLESGEDPFKLCIHYRDWVPGEFISKQIINSVLDSRRTLVILSNNFMESIWGKMEFRTAHMQAINEGRARVIVIIYGDLDESNLGDEMKAYLKTNTYVKWGDPWFWSKLKYALPHSKNKRKILSLEKIELSHFNQNI